jgi:hypothetical protein
MPQTGAYSLVQAISLLFLSSVHSLSFFVQLKIDKAVKRKIIFFISIFIVTQRQKLFYSTSAPTILKENANS